MSSSHRRRRQRTIKQIKIFLLITLLCLVIAAAISFITGRVPSFIDNVISKQVTRRIEEEKERLTKEVGKDLSGGGDQEKLKKLLKEMKSGGR